VVLIALGLLGLSAVLGILAVVVSLSSEAPQQPATVAYAPALQGRGESSAPSAQQVVPAPNKPLLPERFNAPVTRLVIPSIGVDAETIALGINARGEMATPEGPFLVGWYDFTAKPGLGGNAVFSAHLDYINYGPAVFWNLEKLKPGDDVSVRLSDGTLIRYKVTASQSYTLDKLDMAAVLAPTSTESVTLITCDGAFDGREYEKRLVVRAIRTAVDRPAS
jgi:LPXTG-site transpeptidase (sortase) family protein